MRKLEKASFSIACALLLPLFCSAQSGKVESIGPPSDSAVPNTIRLALNAKGYHLTLDGERSVELWLRANIPSQAKKESEDIVYNEIPESTFVGVVHFLKPASDFRGQQIAAGFYTLRYAVIPNDGNHLGVSPNRDFLLLVPAALDTDPSFMFKFEQLAELSRKATGTRHPGPLSLLPPKGKYPALSRNDQEYWIFSAAAKLVSGEDLPLALVVEGTAQQ